MQQSKDCERVLSTNGRGSLTEPVQPTLITTFAPLRAKAIEFEFPGLERDVTLLKPLFKPRCLRDNEAYAMVKT